MTTEFIKFRLFRMPCCGIQICWVNPRTPNYCPECGTSVLAKLKFNPDNTLVNDEKAKLVLS